MLSKVLKAVTALLAVVLLIVLLSGCAQKTALEDEHDERFKEIYRDFGYYIVVDMDTGVEYVVSNGSYNRGTFTMLCDSYGNPYVYPAFDAREDKPNGT